MNLNCVFIFIGHLIVSTIPKEICREYCACERKIDLNCYLKIDLIEHFQT